MTEPVTGTVAVANRRGLHARAAAKFVKTAESFQSELTVAKQGGDGTTVSGRSILGLMMLGAEIGSSLRIEGRGEDAEALVAAITSLVADKFGEGE